MNTPTFYPDYTYEDFKLLKEPYWITYHPGLVSNNYDDIKIPVQISLILTEYEKSDYFLAIALKHVFLDPLKDIPLWINHPPEEYYIETNVAIGTILIDPEFYRKHISPVVTWRLLINK